MITYSICSFHSVFKAYYDEFSFDKVVTTVLFFIWNVYFILRIIICFIWGTKANENVSYSPLLENLLEINWVYR